MIRSVDSLLIGNTTYFLPIQSLFIALAMSDALFLRLLDENSLTYIWSGRKVFLDKRDREIKQSSRLE